ncbi:MAG: hypothetical protein GX786_04995 [Clostridiales bacterium]|nr:hypothetical protein [Clostridiales bacterium]
MGSYCSKKGVALCNLRKGHIVVIVDSKVDQKNKKWFLTIDSNSESAHEEIKDHVEKVIEESKVSCSNYHQFGIPVGASSQYGMFWVEATLPKDYNLLYLL